MDLYSNLKADCLILAQLTVILVCDGDLCRSQVPKSGPGHLGSHRMVQLHMECFILLIHTVIHNLYCAILYLK